MLLKKDNIERSVEDRSLIESLIKQGYKEIKVKKESGKKNKEEV